MFYRVFLQSDGTAIRGAYSDGRPRPDESVWFDPSTGIILHFRPGGARSANHISNLPGNSFTVFFFDRLYSATDRYGFGPLSLEELIHAEPEKPAEPEKKREPEKAGESEKEKDEKAKLKSARKMRQ